MYDLIQIRRDTAANWLSTNPVLGSGEFGLETDTKGLKVGDGSTLWASLEYFRQPNVRQTLADGTTVSWDMAAGVSAYLAAGGDRVMENPSNLVAGQQGTLLVYHDGASRVLTWGTSYKNTSAVALSDDGAGVYDLLSFKTEDVGGTVYVVFTQIVRDIMG